MRGTGRPAPSCFQGSLGRGCWYTSWYFSNRKLLLPCPETHVSQRSRNPNWSEKFSGYMPNSKLPWPVFPCPLTVCTCTDSSGEKQKTKQKKSWFVNGGKLSKKYSHHEMIVLFWPYWQTTGQFSEKKKRFLFNIWWVCLTQLPGLFILVSCWMIYIAESEIWVFII